MSCSTGYSLPVGTGLLLHDAGIDTRNVLARAGLPPDLLTRGTVQLLPDSYFRFWSAIEEEADDPSLPIRLGNAFSVHAFDPLIFAATCSRNFDVAIERIAAYKRLIGPMRISTIRRDDRSVVEFEWPGRLPIPTLLAVSELSFVVALIRFATRSPVRPLRVVTVTPPLDGAPFHEYFGVDIEHGPVHAVTFSTADSSRPFLTVNDDMWAEFEPRLRLRLADLDRDTSATTRVHAALLDLLPAGESSVSAVARVLAMSPRTLQRRLRSEGTSFQDVLGQTRYSLARHYLGRTELPNDDVAFLLGYVQTRSFLRAFSDWAGETPGQFRRRNRTTGSSESTTVTGTSLD